MKKSIIATFVSSAGLMMVLTGHADVLQMPDTANASTPAPRAYALTLPGRGMSKEQVENRFGIPSEKIPPVGEPPISRWVYGDFTVYFEHNLVLHSVTHQR